MQAVSNRRELWGYPMAAVELCPYPGEGLGSVWGDFLSPNGPQQNNQPRCGISPGTKGCKCTRMDAQYQAKHLLETGLTLFLKAPKRKGTGKNGEHFSRILSVTLLFRPREPAVVSWNKTSLFSFMNLFSCLLKWNKILTSKLSLVVEFLIVFTSSDCV